MHKAQKRDNNIKITLTRQLQSLHQECLVVEFPIMGGLASHCHERLTNTKRKQEVWKRIKENGEKRK